MTDPRNIAHDKRVQKEKKRHGPAASRGSYAMHRPGTKPHQQSLPGDHGPDADEPVDKTESGEEP